MPCEVFVEHVLPYLHVEHALSPSGLLLASSAFAKLFLSPPFRGITHRAFCVRRFRSATHPPRFPSARAWLRARPHARPGGLYVLKSSHIRRITRDMWTSASLPPGVVLKNEWYRYLLFVEGGDAVGYLQSSRLPEEVLPKFRSWLRCREASRSREPVPSGEVATGRYTSFKGGNVRVETCAGYADIFFELRVLPGTGNRRMTLERHYSVDAKMGEPVFYDVPSVEHGEQLEGVFRWRTV
ncbi:hypothetical protein TeGR_g7346 [Tetraparma gracilis]|uniref:Uncharacterized protein n=1 Tax=Tetraparma gracilis TaxID=2962635 RepID=A0ABQ6N5D3_9STRA|nr:hypothetical protein TeGR_g7346 [Tetraparma gracilis]